MSINITAENVHDAMQKMGLSMPRADIRINWRRGDMHLSDYGRIPEPGCIVDATSIPGEEVARSFTSTADALRYITAMLKKHDAYVKTTKEAEAKRLRHEARLAAAKKRAQCIR